MSDTGDALIIDTTAMFYPELRQVNLLRTGAQFQIPTALFVKLREARSKFPHVCFRPFLIGDSMRRQITAYLAITGDVGKTENECVGILMKYLCQIADFSQQFEDTDIVRQNQRIKPPHHAIFPESLRQLSEALDALFYIGHTGFQSLSFIIIESILYIAIDASAL